jgi:hypothetical protein
MNNLASAQTDHEQAMSVLLEPAIKHFDEAKHSFDDPDRMLDFGPLHHARAHARAREGKVDAGAYRDDSKVTCGS